MIVYGFVGASGTGKSYRVTDVAAERGIEYIIDDGLLIRSGNILAGTSAKAEATKFASVKRALFFNKVHADSVRAAIAENAPEKLLIVGTSVAMVQKIAASLQLPPPADYIHIEDVSTPEEIATAMKIRTEQGKHVIPVPTFQVKKDFSGYWLDPLQIFRQASRKFSSEKTVVRPTYSYLGDYVIANSVLITICTHETRQVEGVVRVLTCGVEAREKSVVFHMELNLRYGVQVQTCAAEIKRRVLAAMERLTAIYVEEVYINVKQLTVK